jgi:hypothetical protein
MSSIGHPISTILMKARLNSLVAQRKASTTAPQQLVQVLLDHYRKHTTAKNCHSLA